MKSLILVLLAMVVFTRCNTTTQTINTISPDGRIQVEVVESKGKVGYLVKFNNKIKIDTSFLGFDLQGQPSLSDNLSISGIEKSSFSETWEMPWGEQRVVENNYKQLVVKVQEKQALQRKFDIIFKVYNDGLGFRYAFPNQAGLDEVIIEEELTEFNLTGDHQVWWIPGDWDIYEHLYNNTSFSKIDALSKRNHPNLAQTFIPENAVNTPVTMKTKDGTYLSFHEADLTDYAGMTLLVDNKNLKMKSGLVDGPEGYAVKTKTPFITPWRTIQITDNAGDLIESNLIVNLNDPAEVEEIPWFKPMKYVGIWWEMHMGKSSWDVAAGKHGATTQNAKRHIDFAAANNIGGVLVEGWNTGWERWIGFPDREGVFDFVTPYPDYNLEEVVAYAKEKGVEIIMHHETSAAPRTYDQQLDTAYQLMKSLGIHSVKTGYVGPIIPEGVRHHGQWMVNHYNNVIDQGLKYEVAINAHEPIKATGRRRTYPNEIAREGLRGQEFNAWASDGGNPPSHLPTVAFTRMLAGPIDFTPGIFDIKFEEYKPNNQVNTTLAQQLALYVVIYSPIQMAADLIENYDKQPAFQFIRDVAVDWEQSKVIDGEVGDFVIIARQERDSENWFIGGITGDNSREVDLNFDFLKPDMEYDAIVYKDGQKAHWNDNPLGIEIETIKIKNIDSLKIKMVQGGGFAISLLANQ
ncbi:MAG: glycoside hydrolase family 97 protein [Cyclobacteriaceae bacterium]